MYGLNNGEHRVGGNIHLIKVGNDALSDFCGNIGILGRDRSHRAVFLIFHIVERRDIEALKMGRFSEKRLFCIGALVLHLYIQICKLGEGFLTLSDGENIHKIRHRLRVVGAGTASKNKGVFLSSVLCPKRNAGKIEHIQRRGIAKLVLQSESHNVKGFQLIA